MKTDEPSAVGRLPALEALLQQNLARELRREADFIHDLAPQRALLLRVAGQLEAIHEAVLCTDDGSRPWDGCSGHGRPSCTATECMYGLDQTLKPKAGMCAFVDQGSVVAGLRADPATLQVLEEKEDKVSRVDHQRSLPSPGTTAKISNGDE